MTRMMRNAVAMTRRAKCGLGKHQDRLMRGGTRVECTACGDQFPCENRSCGHFDCAWERDEPGSAIGGELGFQVARAVKKLLPGLR